LHDVWITGVGIVSPLGIGCDAVAQALQTSASGIRSLPELEAAGWLAPYGGVVADFEPKEYVQPRKSLKVMAREIQFAFAAADMAHRHAGLPTEGVIDPERFGVVVGAGLLYCDLDELTAAYQACLGRQGFDFSKWGDQAVREFFPLWMLKYLPNMSACHIGIRHDARGPCNTISHGDVSSLLALDEAAQVIRRGQADVMLAGGASSRLSISDLLWHRGARVAQSDAPPETICRPFDVDRSGMVMGEGAAMLVLESREFAEKRGAEPLARWLGSAMRQQGTIATRQPPVDAISGALRAVLKVADLAPQDLSHISAHGMSTREDDPGEASAINEVLEGARVPVTAIKSSAGNLGAGGGAVELAASLIAARQGFIPPTLNHRRTDPACPIEVAAAPREQRRGVIAKLNHTATGQAVAVVIAVE
jgi:3-oxoacyl-[acyl-carrier-protein] synthase II